VPADGVPPPLNRDGSPSAALSIKIMTIINLYYWWSDMRIQTLQKEILK
jgi:hypothetical protein